MWLTLDKPCGESLIIIIIIVIYYVGELTDIMWASHLLCGRVCYGEFVCGQIHHNSPRGANFSYDF